MKYERISDHILGVTDADGVLRKFDGVFLTKQHKAIVKQRDRELKARERELQEVEELLHQCERLRIRVQEADLPQKKKSLAKRIWAFLTKPRGLL